MNYRELLSAALVCLPLCNDAVAASSPRLDILLRPHGANDSVDYVDVSMQIESPNAIAGKPFAHLPLVTVSRPGIPLEAKDIMATDAAGELTLKQEVTTPEPSTIYRNYTPLRPTAGDVKMSYRAYVNKVDASSKNGPLFDLRGQPGGMNGGGITFLVLPVSDSTYDIHLKWDMSGMPSGASGTNSHGDGDIHFVGSADQAADSFYYAGLLHKYVPPSGSFTMYWTSPPPFDIDDLSKKIGALYGYQKKFFEDTAGSYRVFIRENPFHGTGGTAQANSFMFSYSTLDEVSPLSRQLLIAHEMTHNWPLLDEDYSKISWFNEGTAEYYSLLLSWRAGQLTAEQYINEINARIQGYFANPLHTQSNSETTKSAWTDTRAQTIPYGRGLLYFINADASIRAATQGKDSVDSSVLWVVRERRAGRQVKTDQWLSHIGQIIGMDKARADFKLMAAGKQLRAEPNALAPCFEQTATTVHTFDLGFNIASLASRVVSGLDPRSAAAAAGVKDGDKILEASDTYSLQRNESTHMKMVALRDGKKILFDYIPRSLVATPALKWNMPPTKSDMRCSL